MWKRDGGRCTFEQDGRRCECRDGLELDHVVPFARGGDHSLDNLRLLCRSHNGYAAEGEYGRELIAEVRCQERARERA